MRCFDLELLNVCRLLDCEIEGLHKAHGPRASAISVARAPQAVERIAPEVPRDRGISQAAVDATYQHVGVHVPRPFGEIIDAVRGDFGSVDDRTVQKSIRFLVDVRAVASLGSTAWAMERLRSNNQPGWYIRYDSPRLWQRDGLRDLMNVVAEQGSVGW